MAFDDSAILPEERLLRRARPLNNCIGRDLVTGRPYPLAGALTVDSDGMSVYRSTLLAQEGMSEDSVITRKDHWVFAILACQVREIDWGVLYTPDSDDERIGFAHSSIVSPRMPPGKAAKLALREQFAAVAELVKEP